MRGATYLMRAQEAIDRARPVLYEISQLLNTQLDKATLATCVGMIENGVNPEALAVRAVVLCCVVAIEALKDYHELTARCYYPGCYPGAPERGCCTFKPTGRIGHQQPIADCYGEDDVLRRSRE